MLQIVRELRFINPVKFGLLSKKILKLEGLNLKLYEGQKITILIRTIIFI